MEYQEFLNGLTSAGGASEENIKQAEQELNVRFPKSYRQFLADYGAVVGNGFEVAGLFDLSEDEPPMWRHITSATKQHRRVAGGALSETLLPISDNGTGITFFLQTAIEENGHVIAYGPGVDCSLVASSFEEFILKCASGEELV